jgi:hypothetical protein
MTTVRVFSDNKRMATGKEWNGTFLQVYPTKKQFSSQTAWRDAWTTALSPTIQFEMDGAVQTRTVTVTPSSSLVVSIPGSSAAPKQKSPSPTTKGWSYRKELTFTAPAGTYYIGDLCYALYENIYDNVFGGHGYDSGFYSKGGAFFMVSVTAYGDGDYIGSDGHHYLVDAGIIGICSADLIDPKNPSVSGGKIHTFTQPVKCSFAHGAFHFISGYNVLSINTEATDEYYE